MRILPLIFLFAYSLQAEGQQPSFTAVVSSPHYQDYVLEGGIQGSILLQPDSIFTSVALTLPHKEAFAGLICVVGSDTIRVEPAVHQPEDNRGLVSNLIVSAEPRHAIMLIGEITPSVKVLVHFFYAEPLKEKVGKRNERRMLNPCEEPEAVPQSEWRKGLPEPEYIRSYNDVGHLIVHHSASGNNTTNYTEEVRNYYLWHTQRNGWSDIGYNYLIAPDGTIYAGRDPDTGAQDDVTGAHFCGANRQTMGVCLIGDYSQREPSLLAMEQLAHLLSWKAYKDGLNPLDFSSHPANPSLGVIAGHRDGCATLCPGDRVYRRLPELRLSLAEKLEHCEEGIENEEVWVYYASGQQEICLAGVKEEELISRSLFNVQGKEVLGSITRLASKNFCFKKGDLAPGVYFLRAGFHHKFIKKKILLF